MNWWNAYAWCDAQGRRLFERYDCGCSDTTANCAGNKCPEMNFAGSKKMWTGTPGGSSSSFTIHLPGSIANEEHNTPHQRYALCY